MDLKIILVIIHALPIHRFRVYIGASHFSSSPYWEFRKKGAFLLLRGLSGTRIISAIIVVTIRLVIKIIIVATIKLVILMIVATLKLAIIIVVTKRLVLMFY